MADVNANIGVSIDASDALSELKKLQRQISQFHTSIAKSSATAAMAQRNLQTDFLNAVNATGKFAAEMRTVKSASESFTTSLEKNKFSMREYFRYGMASTKSFGRLFRSEFDTIGKVAEDRVRKLQTQYVKMGRDANGSLKAISITPLALDMDNLATKTMIAAQKQQLFNQLLKQGTTNLINFGKNTQWAGRQLMVGFTVPLTIFGSAATRIFMDVEKQALRFRRVYGDLLTSRSETDTNLEMIRGLAKEFTKYGIAISDTMSLAADAAAAGFQGARLQETVKQATRLSVLGELDKQQAFQATISLQSAFKMSNEELAESVNFLNAVENQTVVSLDDITQAIPRVAPIIRGLGGDVRDLAVFMSAMQEGGVDAASAANGLKSALGSLINPSKAAKEMLAGVGVNLQEITERNKGNLMRTVLELGDALKTLEPLSRQRVLEKLFGKYQFARVSALFDNLSRSGSQAQRAMELVGMSAQDLSAIATKELGAIEENAAVKFKAAVEALKTSLAPVGEIFIRIVTPIIELFTKIADKFNGLSDNTKRVIAVIVTVIGGVAPVLLMLIGLFANFAGQIGKFFGIIRNAYLKLSGQSQILGEQTNYLTMEQMEAAAVAHSLDQVHAQLTQRFTSEAAAVDKLRVAYSNAAVAAAKFAAANPQMMLPGMGSRGGKGRKKYSGGVVSVPGSGSGDTVPAMLTPGEAVIPSDMAKKYAPLIEGMIANNIPGFKKGRVGSGREGNKYKSNATIPRNLSDNTGKRAAPIDTSDILDVSSVYVDEVIKEAGVSLKSVSDEIKQWEKANKTAIDSATDAVNAGVPAQEAFASVSEKFNVDMEEAGGPVSKMSKAAQKLMPELQKDLIEAQEYAKKMNLNLQDGADVSKIADALPNNKFIQKANKPGPFQSRSKARGALTSIFGGKKLGKFGVPRFMMSPDITPDSLANKASLSQEHITQNIQQKEDYVRLRKVRQSGKNLVSSTVDGVKEQQQSKSPSKVAKQLALDFGNGYDEGLKASKPKVKKSAKDMTTAAVTGASETSNNKTGKLTGTKARLSNMRGKLAGGGAGASAAVIAASFAPGAIGELASKIMPVVFGFQALATLFPLLMNPLTAIPLLLGGLAVSVFLLNKAADKAAKEIEESAKREAAARIGSAEAIDEYAKFLGDKSTPSAREFDRDNRRMITAEDAAVKRFESFYSQQNNVSTATINQASMKGGKTGGTAAAAIDIANRAAVFGLSPKDIAANIKAAADLIGADQVDLTMQVQKLLAPNGKDILKEPLTIDARMNFLNTETKQSIQKISKEISAISSTEFPKLLGIFDKSFEDIKRTAGSQAARNKYAEKGGLTNNLKAYGTDIMTGTFGKRYQDDLDAYNTLQLKVQAASIRIGTAFKQQTESLALLNSQYTDGLITKEQYDASFAKSFANFELLASKSKELVKALNKIDSSGELASAAVKDLATNAFAELSKINPDFAKKIKKALSDLPRNTQIDLYMGYANGSLTILDLAIIPDILKKIDGKTFTVAMEIIAKSDLSSGGKGLIDSTLIKKEIDSINKQLKGGIDPKLLIRKAELEKQLKEAAKAEQDAAKVRQRSKEKEGTGKVPGDSDTTQKEKESSILDELVKKYRDLGNQNGKLTEGYSESKKALQSAFKAGTDGTTGLEQKLKNLGAGETLINLITGMSKEEWKKYSKDFLSGGQLTTFAKNINKLDQALTVKSLVSDFGKLGMELKNKETVLKNLILNGMNYGEALDYVNGLSQEQVRQLAQLKSGDGAWKSLANGALEYRIELMKTIEGQRQLANQDYSDAMDYFNAQEDYLMATTQYLGKTHDQYQDEIDLQQQLIDGIQDQIDAQQRLSDNYDYQISQQERLLEPIDKQIQALNDESDILNNNLTIIGKQEEAINDQFDKQVAALEEVKRVNQDIVNQNKAKLSIADAITQGDIGAAASAIQEMRAQQAAAQGDIQSKALEASRKQALDGVTAGGMTRDQIEQRVYQIGQQTFALEQQRKPIQAEIERLQGLQRQHQDAILAIQRNQLIPAQDALKKAQDAQKAIENTVKAQIENELYLGKNKKAYELAKIEAEKVYQEARKIAAQTSIAASKTLDAYNNWKSLASEPDITKRVTIITTNIVNTVQGTTTGPGGGGGGDEEIAMYGGMIKRMANGGIVPRYLGNGGNAVGSDTVPAMLTPGEFVMNRAATRAYAPLLASLNESKYPGMASTTSMSEPTYRYSTGSDSGYRVTSANVSSNVVNNSPSLYNYSLSVNVDGSNSDANDIANVVMRKLKNMSNYEIKGQRV